MKKKTFIISAIFAASIELFARDAASNANKKTALRYLNNSASLISKNQWNEAFNQTSLGIAYDDSISDLWYLLALENNALGKNKAEVSALLEQSLSKDNWVNYNRDNARLMQADLYCETGRSKEALELLDLNPKLFSADSEFVRAKSYYRLGDSESISIARTKIDAARRIYPKDSRFPLVFFKNEFPGDPDVNVRRLSEYFVSVISTYAEASPDKDAELEIYAAYFAEEQRQKLMLKSFAARHLSHPLYPIVALQCGLISEEKAFDLFVDFADDRINYDFLCNFIALISEEEVLAKCKTYFEAYSGTILQDTDFDGIENLTVKYNRGRPELVSFDKNQDGITEWSVNCDFGLPVSGELEARKMKWTYYTFPYLATVDFKGAENSEIIEQKFNIVAESLRWSPVDIKNISSISEKISTEFFYPHLNESSYLDGMDISTAILLDTASDYEVKSRKLHDERIHFVLLNGKIRTSLYYEKDVLYAQAQFEENVPVLRVVDCDSDGIFETTEFYDIDVGGTRETHSLEEEQRIISNLYGVPSNGAEFYLRMIQIDRNGDTIPDYTEEYLEKGGKIISWDNDASGNWDIRHVLFPKENNGDVVEQDLFVIPPSREVVSVKYLNGNPVEVMKGNEKFLVYSDASINFYWLRKENSLTDDAKYTNLAVHAKKALDEANSQGVSVIVHQDKVSAICVRIGLNDYGILIDDAESVDSMQE